MAHKKMALVSGPRQCGKTTLAKMLLRKRKVGLYRNWDQVEFRREWTMNPSGLMRRWEHCSVGFGDRPSP